MMTRASFLACLTVCVCPFLGHAGVVPYPDVLPASSSKFGEKFYTVIVSRSPAGITWSEAATQALRWSTDTHLATIKNSDENDFIWSLIDPIFNPQYWGITSDGTASKGPWLGGFQLFGEIEPGGEDIVIGYTASGERVFTRSRLEGWHWVDGSAIDYNDFHYFMGDIKTGFDRPFEVTTEYWKEPNNTGGIEHFLAFGNFSNDPPLFGRWNDLPNDGGRIDGVPVRAYVVESLTPLNVVPIPPVGLLFGSAIAVLGVLRARQGRF